MRRNRFVTGRRPALPLLTALFLALVVGSPLGARSTELHALLVGGGPEPEHNQVAIERNVHYVARLLPAGAPRLTLFADGDPKSKTVLYEEEPKQQSPAEHVFELLTGSEEDASPTIQRFRAPDLGRLDGPARRTAVTHAFDQLRREDAGPVLLYFTGHGSRAQDGNLDNNVFDLWGERLSVRDLAAQIASLPPEAPVTLVMVQCFSGAFGNVLFSGGDPNAAPVDRVIAGFFAATPDRMAAGCTPEVNEAEYHDFTSYFFAALSGRDRVGRPVTGADYNHDGRVGMDEAFDYSLSHDASIDVPVCTSDVFLRRVVQNNEEELFRTEYTPVRSWATVAQGAALDELSRSLGLTGESRLGDAYARMRGSTRRFRRGTATWATVRRFNDARQEARQWLLDRWPALKRKGAPGFAAAHTQAIAALDRRLRDAQLQELLAAEEAVGQADEKEYQTELAGARVLRFCRLAKSVMLAHRLRESGDSANRNRFERIVAAEAGTLFPPSSVARARLTKE